MSMSLYQDRHGNALLPVGRWDATFGCATVSVYDMQVRGSAVRRISIFPGHETIYQNIYPIMSPGVYPRDVVPTLTMRRINDFV